MNTERLDPLSKILLATQSINFLAATINQLMVDHEYTDAALGNTFSSEYKQCLEAAISQLTPIMEGMGEFLNGHDAVCPIDVRITKAAFDILVSGKDDVNN